MATLTTTPIKTFVSGETVTPTKLNELSQSAVALTAGTIVAADLAANAVTTAKILDANVTNVKIASGVDASKLTTGTLPVARIADGSIAPAKLSQPLTSTATTATTSGTFVDLAIPAWAQKITLALSGVQGTAAHFLMVQLGSGSATTSGYVSGASNRASGATAADGFLAFWTVNAVGSGIFTFAKIAPNTWVSNHVYGTSNAPSSGAGVVTLPGDISLVRLTTTPGTATFTAGNMAALYE